MAPRTLSSLPLGHATRSRGFSNDTEQKKAEKQVKSDLSKLKKALNAMPAPKKLAPKPLTLELVKEIAKMDTPKRAKKQSKLLVKQYTPKRDDFVGWGRCGPRMQSDSQEQA